MTSEIPQVQLVQGNFARVRVHTQDVIVVTSTKAVPDEVQAQTLAIVKSIFPGNRILFLDDGMQVGVLAPLTEQEEIELSEDED